MPAGDIELAYMRVGDALRGTPPRNGLRGIAGGVVGVADVILCFLPSGITSGKLDVRSNGGEYSRVRSRGLVFGEGGAKEPGTEVGARVIVALSDFERAWPLVITKKRFLAGGSVKVGLIGDRKGEAFREARKSSEGCEEPVSDVVVVVFATGGNGFASGIGGGGVEKNVECGISERVLDGEGYARMVGCYFVYMMSVCVCKATGRR